MFALKHASKQILRRSLETVSKQYALKGTLHLVATPIGCLDDITQRAISVFKQVDIILAEDTRTTGFLLSQFGINKEIISLNQENEQNRIPSIIEMLKNGKSVALTSDAGTPVISDPGSLLVQACLSNHIRVTPIPGANAGISSLICSGFYTTPFNFYGFIKRSGKDRKNVLQEIQNSPYTTIVYESSHRIDKTLHELEQFEPDRRICICRELTKHFESIQTIQISSISDYLKSETLKGEFSIVIEGMKEFKERKHIQKDERTYSIESIQECLHQLSSLGVDRSTLQKAFSASFQLTNSEIKSVLFKNRN